MEEKARRAHCHGDEAQREREKWRALDLVLLLPPALPLSSFPLIKSSTNPGPLHGAILLQLPSTFVWSRRSGWAEGVGKGRDDDAAGEPSPGAPVPGSSRGAAGARSRSGTGCVPGAGAGSGSGGGARTPRAGERERADRGAHAGLAGGAGDADRARPPPRADPPRGHRARRHGLHRRRLHLRHRIQIAGALTFSAASAAAGITTLINDDLESCYDNPCPNFMSATAMAFLSSFVLAPCCILNLGQMIYKLQRP